jgi:hypothetical protein
MNMNNTLPNVLQPSFYCSQVEGCIPIGTIVRLKESHNIVRIVSYDGAPTMDEGAGTNISLVGSVFKRVHDPEPFVAPVHPLFKGIRGRELVMTNYSKTFLSDDIDDIVFLFSAQKIEAEGYVLHGIDNAFFIRYGTSQTPIDDVQQFRSFASSYSEYRGHSCFPSNMWRSIVVMQNEFRHTLSRYGQACQGNPHSKHKIRFHFSKDAYFYMLLRLKKKCVGLREDSTISTRIRPKLIAMGLEQITLKTKEWANKLVLYQAEHFEAFASMFSMSSLFGVRVRRPRLGNNRKLFVNDMVNFIAGPPRTSEDDQPEGWIRFTMAETELIVELEYDCLVYTPSDINGTPTDCPDKLLSDLIKHRNPMPNLTHVPEEESVRYPNNISVGRQFFRHGKLFTVHSISKREERIECKSTIANDGTLVFHDGNLLSNLIRQHYFG